MSQFQLRWDPPEQAPGVARVVVGVLFAVALVAIVSIVSGSELDSTTAKVLETALTLGFLSLVTAAGANLARRRPELGLLGFATVAVAVVAFAIAVLTFWTTGFSAGDHWRPAVYSLLIAFGAGVVAVLLTTAAEQKSEEIRLARGTAVAAVTVLVILVLYEISSPGRDVDQRLLAVVAVVFLVAAIALIVLAGSAPSAAAAGPADPGRIRIDHVVIAVTDRAASANFYKRVLGAEIVEMPGSRFAYRVGDQLLNVHDAATSAQPLAREPVRPGNSDLCFTWPGPPETAVTHLQRLSVEIIEGPVIRYGAGGPGNSVYFRDPDGSLIELIAYPS